MCLPLHYELAFFDHRYTLRLPVAIQPLSDAAGAGSLPEIDDPQLCCKSA
jgi:hypothetical protein